jgi:hypothetical protein
MARPVLELEAVARAIEHEEARRREAHAAAPGEGEAAMRLLDEIVEIGLPAMVEIAEEHQPAAIVDERPMGEMNGAHAAEIAVGGDHPQHQAEGEMADLEQGRPEHARLHQNDAAHVVLRDPILPLGHLADQLDRGRRAVLRRIATLEPADPQQHGRQGEKHSGHEPQQRHIDSRQKRDPERKAHERHQDQGDDRGRGG